MHAELRIGDSVVMMCDEFPDWGALSPEALKGSPVGLHLYVSNVDSAFDRAVKAGCTPKMPPADMFWGDRYSKLTDPFGHQWSIATRVRNMTPEEIAKASADFHKQSGC